MKTKYTFFALLLAIFTMQAQDRTTVRANSSDISDNLDLRAVASLFGESSDLADFEQRLNDPKMQISNLDLNGDNRVDYLRVVEAADNGVHVIIIQSVLDRDVFQDIATIEVERDRNNNVQVQVVGDVYMYGNNYIYEPVYVARPAIFNVFWGNYYRPYVSPWYWDYYPSYYYSWNPYPIYRYRRNVNVHINVHNHYNYVNVRRSDRAVALHQTRRTDGYATRNPQRSFTDRNQNMTNRYELDRTIRSNSATRETGTRGATQTRSTNGTRNTVSTRNNSESSTRATAPVRSNSGSEVRSTRNNATQTSVRNNGSVRNTGTDNSTRVQSQARPAQTSAPTRSASPRNSAPASTPRVQQQRSEPARSTNVSRGNQSNQRSAAPQQARSSSGSRESRSSGNRG